MKSWLQHRYSWLNHEWDLYRDCIPDPSLPLVITMINYHPVSQLGFNADDLEFLCILNNSDDTVNASGVYFRELGLTYTFPAGSTIPPHGEVFLASNAEAFQQCFGETAYGEFLRHLDNKSESLVLADAWGNIIDEVTYSDTIPWPVNADGHGDFLILLDPDLDNALPENWISADNFVGVPQHELPATLRLSPNPTTDILNVECELIDKEWENATLVVLDINGNIVRTIMGANNTSSLPIRINVADLATGTYFIRVTTKAGSLSKPFVKK